MKKGQIITITEPRHAFDDFNEPHVIFGPVLVLETNEYDLTFLSTGKVLYTHISDLPWE